MIAAAPFVLIVNNQLPVNTFAELIAYTKANPGKLNFSSAGIGTTNHLGVELLNSVAGVDFQHIPFKGAAPAITALIAGQIHMTFGPILQTIPLLKQKQVKAIAFTGAQRSPVLPDLPTVAESGYPSYQSYNWYGVVAPAKTPPAIIDRLNREIVRHLSAPEVRTQLSNDGAQVYGNSPKEFNDIIRAEAERSKRLIKALNLAEQ